MAFKVIYTVRSLILIPIESAYATSIWSSIVTLALSCTVSEVLQKQHPSAIPHEFWGVFLGLDCRCWVSEERRPYAHYSCNYFPTKSTYTPTVRQRHGRTDERTTYDSNTALGLRASRDKKITANIQNKKEHGANALKEVTGNINMRTDVLHTELWSRRLRYIRSNVVHGFSLIIVSFEMSIIYLRSVYYLNTNDRRGGTFAARRMKLGCCYGGRSPTLIHLLPAEALRPSIYLL